MPESELRLVRRLAEFRPKDEINLLPHGLRGIYVLYKRALTSRHKTKYNVVYVGMAARGGIRGRLLSHKRSTRKGTLWTHFSVLEVWDNIRNEEIVELEGLFRCIYRKDAKASALNAQRGFKKAKRIRENDLRKWH
jgi:hypothetical protein